ncbi:SDR family NAD(P)-dependent oxidoreductase [Micromonospora wenchangensis]|uniref:SDR family NAD(P)-dependent oxidoreductase n=1 Tax=Micromonospora wenchangensis TaxID=1185415 RepID=UPI003D713956
MTETYLPLAVVTGGSRGIGRCLVEALLDDTAVLNLSRAPAPEPPGAPGHRLHNLSVDLADVGKAATTLGGWLEANPGYRVTAFVSNAATTGLGWLNQESVMAAMERSFSVNVYAPLALTATILNLDRFSRTEDGARVGYVVSSLGRAVPELSFAGLGVYSMTKAALGRGALVQAREFEIVAPHVKVLRIHPGIVDTEIQRELRGSAGIDPRFAVKTAGLPPYRDGEWRGCSPAERMRTISPRFAADFVRWALRHGTSSAEEYDFYHTEAFHSTR